VSALKKWMAKIEKNDFWLFWLVKFDKDTKNARRVTKIVFWLF
jgi:hypothetical protein